VSQLRRRRLLAAAVLCVLIGAPATLLAHADQRERHGPPPTPVPPDGRLSPFPQVLHTPADAVVSPALSARGAVLADLRSGAILDGKEMDASRPIASLTKIMTALVVLERTEPSDVVTVDPDAVFRPDDYGANSTIGLVAGERLRVGDLLAALLLGSANDAAEALAIHVGGTEERFVTMMNRRAVRLGMGHTTFASASGLDDRGRSTPRDLLRLVRAAEANPTFRDLVARRFRTIPAPHGPDRRIQNRNALLWLYRGADGAKTGTTAGAGPCLVATATRHGRTLVAIVLHTEDEPFSDAAALLNHGFEGFEQATVVDEGEDRGTLAIVGGTVPVLAGATLAGLVPVGSGDAVRAVATADPTVRFPPAPGERVGTLTVRAGPTTVGSIPLVAGEIPAPRPVGSPWWVRAVEAMAGGASDVVRGLAT
jgi:serine-type D-Ala-D-Ala carboxypeptidase (penicillin-binding protein 5/6)